MLKYKAIKVAVRIKVNGWTVTTSIINNLIYTNGWMAYTNISELSVFSTRKIQQCKKTYVDLRIRASSSGCSLSLIFIHLDSDSK